MIAISMTAFFATPLGFKEAERHNLSLLRDIQVFESEKACMIPSLYEHVWQ